MIEDLITTAPEEYYFVERKPIIVRREDLAYKKPLPPNAKMSALFEIVKAYHRDFKTMVLFAKKQHGISYSIGFPFICEQFNVKPVIVYPWNGKGALPEWLVSLHEHTQTEFSFVHPNLVTININEAKRVAQERFGFFIPFGFDHALSVQTHSKHFDMPRKLGTLVMATMTGMTLAGAIDNITRNDKQVKKIIGVSCGREPNNVYKAMSKYIDIPNNVEIVNPYPRNFLPQVDQPFPLHPDYELKAWAYLLEHIEELPEPIYFINVGA